MHRRRSLQRVIPEGSLVCILLVPGLFLQTHLACRGMATNREPASWPLLRKAVRVLDLAQEVATFLFLAEIFLPWQAQARTSS